MGATVDERIVAAKFDASDFEKGVNKTIKKLDELKKSLKFDEATKGVKELAEKTEVSTNSMSKSLEKLTDRFTTFTGMIKQKILGGLADEVAGVFLKMEQSVKGFIKSISSDQVNAGMSKYEQMLTSVRVMMSAGKGEEESYKAIERLQEYSDETSYSLSQMTDAMSKMVAAGVDLDKATKNVEGIANACANAGINATDASRAFYNLSQAYSSGSLQYTDYRSLELLNMTTRGFKDALLEAAEAAGTLQKVSDGVYKTINKNDKKVTAGKKVTEKNLRDALKYNFMNTEAMNQLFGGKYWMEVIGREELDKLKKEYKELYGDNWESELKKKYGDLAVTAYEAAKEARNFTDVINALKDAVSSGWAKTFEYFFGKLSQASEFFTNLSNGELADVIYKIGEYRNGILEIWGDFKLNGETFGGGELFRQTILNITDALGTFIKTLLNVLPGFDAFEEDEDGAQRGMQNIAASMFQLSMKARDFSKKMVEAANNFKSFMNEKVFDNGTHSRLDLIREVFSNLLSVFAALGRVVKIASFAFSEVYKTLSPIFDGILVFLTKLTQPLKDLSKNKAFDDIEASIKNIFILLNPVAEVLYKIIAFLGDIGAFFAQMAIDTVASNIEFFSDILGLFVELLTGKSGQLEKGEGVLDKIRKDFEGIKDVCKEGLATVKTFLSTLYSDIKKILGLSEDKNDQNGGIFSGLKNFFETNEFIKKVKDWVNQALIDVGNFIKSIPARVKALGINIYAAIRNLLFTKQKDEKTGEEKEVLTELGEWLNNMIVEVKAFILDIPNKIIKGIGKVTSWIDTIFDIVFGTGNKSEDNKKNAKQEAKTEEEKAKAEITAQFEEFIANTKKSISDWFTDLPNKVTKAFKSVGDFFNKVLNTIMDFLFGKRVKKGTFVYDSKTGKYLKKETVVRVKTGFSKWLDGVIKEVKKFITNIPEYIKKGIKGIGDVVSSIVSAIFGSKDNKEVTNKDVEAKIEKPFLGISLTKVLNTIKEIGWELINQIARIFTGTDDIDKNKEWLAKKFTEAIDWVVTQIPAAINSAWEFVKKLGINIWNGLKNVFTGEEVKEDDPAITKAITTIGNKIKTWLTSETDGLPKYFKEAWNALTGVTSSVWTGFSSVFTGNSLPDDTKDNVSIFARDIGEKVKAWLLDTETGLPKYFSDAWEAVKNFFIKDLPNAFTGISGFISSLFTAASKDPNIDKEKKKYKTRLEKEIEEAQKYPAEGEKTKRSESNPSFIDQLKESFLPAITSIGETIKGWLISDEYGLPFYFNNAWKTLSGIGSAIWIGFSAIFKPEGLAEENRSAVSGFVYDIGIKIKEWLTNEETGLPKMFNDAWNALVGLGSAIWTGFKNIFTDAEVPEKEKTGVSGFITRTGKAIKEWLTNTKDGLPKFFSDAFNDIKDFVIKDLPKVIQDIFEFINSMFSGKQVDKTMSKDEMVLRSKLSKGLKSGISIVKDETDKETQKFDFAAFGESIKTAFLNALSSIGPAILNGLANALNWLGDVATFIVDLITGKKSLSDIIESAYGKEKPELKESLMHVGESLKKFFMETLPKFIGAAIGSLIQNSSKWFGNLFGAMSDNMVTEAEKAGKDATEKLENATDSDKDLIAKMRSKPQVLASVTDFVNKFLGSLSLISGTAVLEAVAIIIVVSHLLSVIKDMLSAADEIEGLAESIKWAAIAIGFLTLTSIVSSIVDLAKNGNEEQMTRVETFMGHLKDVLGSVIAIMAIFVGGKLLDTISDVSESIKDIKTGTGAVKEVAKGGAIGGFLMTLLGAFGGTAAAGFGIEVIGAAISDTLESMKQTLIGVAQSLNSILDPVTEFANKLSASQGIFESGINSVELLKTLIVKFYTAFDSLLEEAAKTQLTKDKPMSYGDSTYSYIDPNTGRQETTGQVPFGVNLTLEGIRAFINIFKERITIFLDTIELLDRVLSTVGKVEDVEATKDKIGKMIDVLNDTGDHNFSALLIRLFNIVDDAFYQADFWKYITDVTNPQKYMNALEGARVYMSILSDVLSVFGGSLASLDESQISAFDHFITVFEQIGEILNTDISDKLEQNSLQKIFHGDTTLPTIGRMFRDFGIYVKQFYDNIALIKGFSASEIDETKEKTKAFLELFNAMLTSSPLVSTFDTIAPYISNIPGFGLAFGAFYENLNKYIGKISTEDINKAVSTTNAITELLHVIEMFGITTSSYTLLTSPDFLNSFGDYGEAFGKFVDSLNTSLESTNTEGFADIAKLLSTGIEAAFNENPELQPKITPVLELGPAEEQLKQFFGVEHVPNIDLSAVTKAATGANSQVDEDRVTSALLSTEIGKVVTAVDGLKNSQVSVSDVSNAFANMRIVTNTGALVGALTDEIDAEIGRKIWLINRGVIPAQR